MPEDTGTVIIDGKPVEKPLSEIKAMDTKVVGGVRYKMTKADIDKKATTEGQAETERVVGLPREINEERRCRIDQGTPVTVSACRTFTIQTRPDDIANITALSLAALLRKNAGLTTPFKFRDANNTDQTLSPDEMITMGEQAFAFLDSVYKKSWAIKDHPDLVTFNIADDHHWT